MRNLGRVRVLMLALVTFLVAATASASQVAVVIRFGPPALPVYEQPLCPGDNYIWTPGYWAFDDDYDDYYWVPGTWVLAPQPGLYWTPGYWAWTGDRFFFNEGYWAPEVGFYGGIVYGFGYFGDGYVGGRWDRGRFFYNRSVTNVNTTIVRNVYNTTVVNNYVTVNRVSYNGGNGGITARPTSQQEAVARQRHMAPVEAQTRQVQAARADRELRASVNQGKPPVAATPEPGRFNDRGVVRAREAGAPYHPPDNRAVRQGENATNRRPENNAPNQRSEGNDRRSQNVVHPRDLPPDERPAPPSTGNARHDQKVQREQEKLQAKQNQERQKLEQKQEREDQKLQQKRADDARRQQMEQRHQQQTQQMEQKHAQQRQRMEQRQPPERRSEARPPKQEHPN